MPESPSQLESRWPHRWAWLLVCATFPLICVGGLVTSTKAGMAVPDWPTTYGYNLFLYPWQKWLFGPWDLFVEHGHRLLGATVGFVTIGLLISVVRARLPGAIRYAALGALVLVVFQGVLGGVRVLLDRQTLAMLHGCVGPLFFAYAVGLCVVTSPGWRQNGLGSETRATKFLGSETRATDTRAAGTGEEVLRLRRLSLVTAAIVYVQLVLGAQLRHFPVHGTPRAFQVVVLFHLFLAAVVVVHAVLVARAVAGVRDPALLVAGRRLCWLACLQILLGVGAWVVRRAWPGWLADWNLAAGFLVKTHSWPHWLIPTAHAAMGSLILALSAVLALRVWQLGSPASAAPRQPVTMGVVL